MEVNAPASSGLLGAFRALIDSLLGAATQRFELLTLELHEEKLRAIQIFVWVSAAIFSAIMAITFVSLTVIYLFWETARLAVLTGFAVAYAGAFVGILWYCRKLLTRQARPFAATLAELQSDRTCIRPGN